MSTDAELTASERDSYEATIAALEARIADTATELDRTDRVAGDWMDEAFARGGEVGRLRARLARVLRLVQQAREWAGVHDGAVWSRRHFPATHGQERQR
jgi:hypothetical protein